MWSRIKSAFRRDAPPALKVPDNTVIGYYFDGRGEVTPIRANAYKSFYGGSVLGNTALAGLAADPTEQGYAYASMVNVWVRRCVDIRSDSLARLDWVVRDRVTDEIIEDHPFTVALNVNTRRNLIKRISRSLDIYGEVYLKPILNDYGFYSAFWWLNNLSTSPVIMDGRIISITYVPTTGGKAHQWQRNEFVYFHTDNEFDDLRGSSLITAVLEEVALHEDMAVAARKYYENDARPGIVLVPEYNMPFPDAQLFTDYWNKNFKGANNVSKAVLLPQNIKELKTVERGKLEDDTETRANVRREICAIFGVPLSIAGAWDDAQYQSAPEQRKALYEETLFPQAEFIARELTIEALPFFCDDPEKYIVDFDTTSVLALTENQEQKKAALNAQLAAGGITLNEYREALELERIPTGDVFYIPSGLIPTPIEQVNVPRPSPSGGLPFAAQAQLPAPAPQTPEPTAETAKVGQRASVVLKFGANPDLVGLQQRLQAMLPEPSVQWVNPDEFHVTLLSLPNTQPEQVQQLGQYLAQIEPPELSLPIGSLASFDNVGEHALHFRIRRNADLADYQEELYLLCNQLGIETSSYSKPNQFIPHITMAYSPQRMRPITFQSKLCVEPKAVTYSVKEGEMYKELWVKECGKPTKSVPAEITPLDELAAWQKFLENRKGKASRPFEVKTLDAEIVGIVNQGIQDNLPLNLVFNAARVALKKSEFVSPEQAALEYWREYDELMAEVGDTWLEDYMRRVWRSLNRQIDKEFTPTDIVPLLNEHQEELQAVWVGTAEEPGILSKLVMGGMAAGQRILTNKRTNPDPRKALELDWSLIPEDAIEFVQGYVFNLIRDLNATTLTELQTIFTNWLEAGGTITELKDQIEKSIKNPVRAQMIAETESTRAYYQGAVQRWEQAGVEKQRWRTVADGLVCQQCRDLNNEVAVLGQGFGASGSTPPLHPRCRCYAVPVLE